MAGMRELCSCKYLEGVKEYKYIKCTKLDYERLKEGCKACVFYCSSRISNRKHKDFGVFGKHYIN